MTQEANLEHTQQRPPSGLPPYDDGRAAHTPVPSHRPSMTIDAVARAAGQIGDAMSRVILGKPHVIRLALVALLTEGHLLIEDVPGTGKTNLAKALARCVAGTESRVQFTPDLMPSDVTGVSIYHRDSGEFTFQPGPIFANVLVADEINRASPKTQSALLEAMEERQVTVDGTSHQLARPFIVLATQNPIEMSGTYPLPEAQRDRFFARTALGYPDADSELAMLADRDTSDPLDSLQHVVDTATVRAMITTIGHVHISPELQRYMVQLIRATRSLPEVRLGCSPRSVLHLGRAAKAAAGLAGRSYVIPDDIQHLATPVLAHRLVLTIEARAAGADSQRLITDVVSRIPVPQHPGR